MRTSWRWPVWAAAATLSLIGGMVLLHSVHALGGHSALPTYGPPVAVVIAGGSVLALPPGGRALSRLRLGCVLVLLLLGVEWVEAELSTSHELLPALLGHAKPVIVTLGAAVGIAVLIEAERAGTAVWEALSARRPR